MAFRIKKKVTARLRVGNEIIEIPDVVKTSKYSWGLMFSRKEKAEALLFEFKKDTNDRITSLFCPPFLAIWLNENNKIVEYKIVSSNKLAIKPEKPFRKLIEVPVNKKYSNVVDFIINRAKI